MRKLQATSENKKEPNKNSDPNPETNENKDVNVTDYFVTEAHLNNSTPIKTPVRCTNS